MYTDIVYLPDQGWSYFNNGSTDPKYTGAAAGEEMGLWYFENGSISFAYNGNIIDDGMRFIVSNSRVTALISFYDVTDQSAFYYEPVYWAADNAITTGWADGSFRPYESCSRAAVVTFLWRLAGSPQVEIADAFSDMTGNASFDMAISWAVREGIVGGWADGTFRPWNNCNRAAIVTFLWRFAGKPAAKGNASFIDMPDNPDFQKAIVWAASYNITTGWADGTFRPWNTCNRLAVASFLYRYANLQ